MNDEQLSERLRSAYAPRPQDPSEAAAFRAAVEARIERRRRRAILVPAAVAAAATAAVAWVLLPFGADPAVEVVADAGAPATTASLPAPSSTVAGSAAEGTRSWEEELIFENALSESSDLEDGEMLPDEYIAIASVFLGG